MMRPIEDPYANLRAMLAPRCVAVIGASARPASVGRVLFERLTTRGFAGDVVPVSPAHGEILGRRAYPTIADVRQPVDLAVIATPAATVPDVVRQCADAGVKGAVVISAGFRETGAAGAALERHVQDIARSSGMRIIGPNCLGIIVPEIGLDATFAAASASAGNIGFVSQSGALCTAILDWAASRNVGFSYFVSAGSMVDVGWSDYLDFLVDDPRTKSILLYMESVGDHPPSFVSSAREAAAIKPVIIMKSGRTEIAARAAASHTGALLGSDDVFDAVLRRCGALRVDTIEDLFDMAEVLAKGKRPNGKRLSIVTNAGGPGVIAADALIAAGGTLSDLSPESKTALDALLPAHWSHGNPIDVLGDADGGRYAKVVDIAIADGDADALLVIYAPQAIARSVDVARSVIASATRAAKPVLAAWMGGAGVADGASELEHADIPTYTYPELAVAAFDYLWRYDDNLRALYETPAAPHDETLDRRAGRSAIEDAIADGRERLSPVECAIVAAAYDIPLVATYEAATVDEAVAAAQRCGYPVALKVRSRMVVHKTHVGGVRLNVTGADDVRRAYDAIREAVAASAGTAAFDGVVVQPMVSHHAGIELILGSAIDPQFGPLVVFGLGGTLVEVFHDRAIGLPPLNATLAHRLMEATRAHAAFGPVRGRAAIDVDELAALIVRFSVLVADLPRIREIDLNPLYASADGMVALDMRVLLHGAATASTDLPKPAIRPYPARYTGTWQMKDGAPIVIRPIRAEDEPLVRDFQRSLSEDSVYMRFANVVRLEGRIAHARLARSCFIDYGREIALVAESTRDGAPSVVGIGNLVRTRRRGQAEFAVLVSDVVQHQGIGTELLRRLVAVGREEGMAEIIGYVLESNGPMLAICRHLGFSSPDVAGAGVVRVRLALD